MSETPEQAKRDFRQEATDLIVGMLEQGTSPWQRPWDRNAAASALAMPHNGVTGRAYSGGNAVYLMARGLQQGYDDPRWMTYEQAQSRGWQVRKGEKATHVEFWQFEKTEKVRDPLTGQESEQRVKLERPIQRLYAVFNARQIDGIPSVAPQSQENWQAIEAAERALANSGARIVHRGTEAFYQPGKDQITMPPKKAFPDPASYYGTALHELAHWTGHESRLNREGITGGHPFGSEGYAREELRAEMASVFLQAELGVPHDIERHASYVGNWIEALRKDKNELFRAAKDAGRAADYVVELSKHRELSDALADSLVERAAANTAARYGALQNAGLDAEVSQRLLAAADHRELERLARESLANPDDRAKVMQRSPFAQAATDREQAQQLDSALRELDQIGSLPLHVAIARNDAREHRFVELRELDAVAYVDRQTGDLTLAAKSPQGLQELLQRAGLPGTAASDSRFWSFGDGQVANLARESLQRLGVPEGRIRQVEALTTAPGQRREQLIESFRDVSAQARQLLGESARTFPAQPDESCYRGPIIAQSEHHLLQQVSPTTTVAHLKTAFTELPQVDRGQPVRIPYSDGHAQAVAFTPERARTRNRSLGR